jgi:hypothetical protein
MVLPALARGGYGCERQVAVGTRPSGRSHLVDVVAEKAGEAILVSLKWQQVGGTAEQKVPFEIICLAEAIRLFPQYKRAYVVLGGSGWTLRDWFVRHVQRHLVETEAVKVVSLEDFVGLANSGQL